MEGEHRDGRAGEEWARDRSAGFASVGRPNNNSLSMKSFLPILRRFFCDHGFGAGNKEFIGGGGSLFFVSEGNWSSDY